MEIVVLVLGIVGFVMSWVIIGAIPAALAILLGLGRLMMKKKRLRKLAKTEVIIGIVFAVLGLCVSVYMYFVGVKDIDFINIVREKIQELMSHLPF